MEAWLAASVLIRSTLEKVLKANGCTKGSLQQQIDEWRTMNDVEVEAALHYAHRIVEDLDDDHTAVEQILISKGNQ